MSDSETSAAVSTPTPPPPARVWKSILLSMLVLAVVFGCRGWLLAALLGGTYAWSSLLLDCSIMALVVLCLRLLDLGVKRGAATLIGAQSPRRRLLASLGSWLVVFFLAAPFLISLVQFHPQKIRCNQSPAAYGLPYTDLTLESDGLALAGWHIPAAAPDRPVVVICHGLGANRQNFLPVAQMLHGMQHHVVMFDFRGHGDSGGRTVTFGYKESADVRAVCNTVRALHPRSPLYGLGYSMGGAALFKAAAEHGDFDKVIVDSTFARADQVALRSMLWFFGPLKGPVWYVGRGWGWLFSGVDLAEHNPEEYVARLPACPVLLIHGLKDRLVPYTDAQHLQGAIGERAELWLVESAGHLQPMGHPAYPQRLQQFFGE